MLTTIIYRSHIIKNAPFESFTEMVEAAKAKNEQADVTGILLFNGTHFFQMIEGPEKSVLEIYQRICQDKRHYNIVELLCDYAPARRFGKTGMELFDLREYAPEEVLQAVLDKGTSKYQLFYNDRALKFLRTFVESTEKENYFEIPPADSWVFIPDNKGAHTHTEVPDNAVDCSFAFQPMVDPFAQKILSTEALLRSPGGDSPDSYFAGLSGNALYEADLKSKKLAFAMASALKLGNQSVSVNLFPMTLVMVPDAVNFLLREIQINGLVPEQVTIEFTESEVISRIDEFTGAVRQLKSAGFSLAIDHFGAGFGGLLLLAQFQPDRIKINRELIKDVHKSGPRQAIIQAIIKCCASLEIAISAVGVEKPEEWMWLEAAGITQFQGNLFASACLSGIAPVAWPERKADL